MNPGAYLGRFFSDRVAVGNRVNAYHKVLTVGLLAILTGAQFAAAAETTGDPMAQIKGFLVFKLQRMDTTAHDYVANANAYQAIIDKWAGDYDRAAIDQGPELLQLITKMQDDYRVYHNHGYETIEGITAGTKAMVAFDTYLDGGVAKSEASTDSPYSPMVLKTRDGLVISDRSGNLFHYVIEPALWGTKPYLVKKLGPAAAKKMKPVQVLPRADVLTASADECAHKLDELLAVAKAWQPTMDECVGALIWMTPTLNGYFDDWKNSRYDPIASQGRYVAESRVLDMQGIMSSLALVCIVETLKGLKPYVRTPEALKLLDMAGESSSSAAQIGQARARIEQVAALEMIRCQEAGDLQGALAWRTLITLPQFAQSISGEMFLQTPDLERAKSPEVSHLCSVCWSVLSSWFPANTKTECTTER